MEQAKAKKFNFKEYLNKHLTATRAVVLAFAVTILIGAALLMLPISTKEQGSLGFIDALFTATSATCVTGLIIFDTSVTFTGFGQVVILLLIQLGGLGFMTLSTMIYILIGHKISLQRRISIKEDLSYGGMDGLKEITLRIVLISVIVESIGAAVLTFAFSKYYPFGKSLWFGIFHSVSAFCNAGFDILPAAENSSLILYNDNPVVLITVAGLIITGGIGFLVIEDILRNHRWRKLALQTKAVLIITLVLILTGTGIFLLGEYSRNFAGMPFWQKVLNAFFHSVTTRTAGFNSFDLSDLSPISYMTTVVWMFIGASPGSTGGGIKTTTLFILVVAVIMTIRQKNEAVFDMRSIGKKTIAKAATVLTLALVMSFISCFIMCLSEKGADIKDILFEQISAYGTVGLSTGLTPELSSVGKIIIIFNMFIGRVGALTFFIAFAKGNKSRSAIQYQEANISI